MIHCPETQLERNHPYRYMQDGFDMTVHVLAGETSLLLRQSHVPVIAVDRKTGDKAPVWILRK